MAPSTPTGIPFPWLRSSAGKADAMLTLSLLFALTGLFCFALGGSSYVGHGLTLTVPKLDGAGVGALMTVVSAYVARRHGVGAKAPAAPPVAGP